MASRVPTFRTVAALAVACGLAAACGGGAPEPAPESGDGGSPVEDLALRGLPAFGALDADEDGTISPGEIDVAATSLAALDDDGDGRLSGDELRPRPGGPIGGPARTPADAAAAFMAFDADEDGALQAAELPSQFLSLLSRADGDGDGEASEAEVLTLMTSEAAPAAEAEDAADGAAEAGDESARPPDPLIAALDADQDGAVSAAELASAADSLRSLDADGDGRLTTGELGRAGGGRAE